MERESKPPPQLAAELNGGGGMFVKVMTDEQIEVLRKQIAVYAAICQNLVDLHKSLTSHNDLTAGARFGNLYCDSFFKSGTPRIAGRQRWSPTPTQLHILERIFDEGTGAPNKLKIKEIARDLSQHGHISETNVYNWFQNRRARSKRKQQAAPGTDAESGIETTLVSPRETKTKEEFQPLQQANSSSVHVVGPSSTNELDSVLPVEGSSKLDGSFEQMSFYESALPNSRMEQIMGKMEVSGGYNPYMQQDDYHRQLDDDC